MISNLRPVSNLVRFERYQASLKSLSAIDLYDIKRRCPLLGINFDPANYSLTAEQIQEWTAHLFWGDKTLSMSDEGRSFRWIKDLQIELRNSWMVLKQDLDEEKCFEILWIIPSAPIEEFESIRKHVLHFLKARNISDSAIEARLRSLNVMLKHS